MHGMQPSSGPECSFSPSVPERGPVHTCRYTEVTWRWPILTGSVVIQNVGNEVGSLTMIVLSWFFNQVLSTSLEIVIHHPAASRPRCVITDIRRFSFATPAYRGRSNYCRLCFSIAASKFRSVFEVHPSQADPWKLYEKHLHRLCVSSHQWL